MICSFCQKRFHTDLTLVDLICYPNLPRRCRECRLLFQSPKLPVCPGCGRFGKKELCGDCHSWQEIYPQLLRNRALFSYDETFKEWIYRFKFLGDYRLKGTFAVELKRAVRRYPGYVVCPLPLSKERFLMRGFNQVSACLEAASIPHQELLIREQNFVPQAKKSKQERLAMTQPFSFGADPKAVKGKKILLADDVYTTGRTLFYAADILWGQGAENVISLTFAR